MPALNLIRILVADAEERTRQWAERNLAGVRRSVQAASSVHDALECARRMPYDVIVLDAHLCDGELLGFIHKFQEAIPDVEIMLTAGNGSVDEAIAAMKNGACDYIVKPFAPERFLSAMEKACEKVSVKRETRRRMGARIERSLSQHIVGRSYAMQYVLYLIEKVAPTEVPVLISGESGTGKEITAMAIHRLSPRAGQPLVVKNCATFVKRDAMAELFGSRRETPAGARRSKTGLLSLAHKGTLFLDEIGDLPLDVQAALLQAIESRTYHRVGDHPVRRADIRYLLVTSRNLEREVQAGRFLASLYHRLSAFRIHLCPLRWRKEDIPPLAEYFLGLHGLHNSGGEPRRISREAMRCLLAHDWPGNVRELRNTVESAAILHESGALATRSLPAYLSAQIRGAPGEDSARSFPSLDRVKRDHILYALECADGNRTRAAQLLGIGRRTLYAKLVEYRLDTGKPDASLPGSGDAFPGAGLPRSFGSGTLKHSYPDGGRLPVETSDSTALPRLRGRGRG